MHTGREEIGVSLASFRGGGGGGRYWDIAHTLQGHWGDGGGGGCGGGVGGGIGILPTPFRGTGGVLGGRYWDIAHTLQGHWGDGGALGHCLHPSGAHY